MSQKMRACVVSIALLAMVCVLTGWIDRADAAEKYPSRAIEIIVPFGAGGTTDILARTVADFLSKKWGVPINVLNKPAGVRVPGLLEVYGAKPDGYTMLQDGSGTSYQMPYAVKNLPFNVMDRTFVAVFADSAPIFIVKPDSPIKNMKDLETEIKKDPANFTWTGMGGASSYDICMRKFLKVIGVDVMKTRSVVVKSATEAISFTTAGAVKVGFCQPGSGGASIAANVVRPLAGTGKIRLKNFPNIPTIVEQGFPAATSSDQFFISGPPNLPSHIVELWDKGLQEMLKNPDIISKMDKIGTTRIYMNAEETKKHVLTQLEEMKTLYGPL